MSDNSLWGEIPKKAPTKTPLGILREQGQILKELTNGLVKGVVEVKYYPGDSPIGGVLWFSLQAPNIFYAIILLNVVYGGKYGVPPDLYPVKLGLMENLREVVKDEACRHDIHCQSEDEFIDALRMLLHSGPVLSWVAELMSQSVGTPGEDTE